MPGLFRLRTPADELQPLGIVRMPQVDKRLAELATAPRNLWNLAAIDVELDRRLEIRPAPSCERCEEKIGGEKFAVLPGTGGLVVHVQCPGGEGGSRDA
jgi:formylmethanofuran dehydrogenase subunit E